MTKNTKIRVKNRSFGSVGYTIPDLNNLHREFEFNEQKELTYEELFKLSQVPGGMYIIENYLTIDNEEVVAALLGEVEPEYYYTAKEDITSEPEQPWYYGDMDKNAVIDVYDLALLKRAVLAGENHQWADCNADGTTGVGDIIALTRYLHRLPEHGQTGQANIT